jgi:hypothetical protein
LIESGRLPDPAKKKAPLKSKPAKPAVETTPAPAETVEATVAAT